MPRPIQVFRPINLALIATIQGIVQFAVIVPNIDAEVFTGVQFFLMTAITVVVAAAGYLINDIFDIETDSHNKPGKNLIGTAISVQTARSLYVSLVFSGAILIPALGKRYILPGIFLYALATASMYAYSAWLKKTPLIGNIVVSVFSALVVYVLWMGQNLVWQGSYNSSLAHSVVWLYAVFAFAATLIREIVKDIEDKDGDARSGGRTFPIVAGTRAARWTCIALVAGLLALLILWLLDISQRLHSTAVWYYIVALIAPVAAVGLAIFRAEKKRQWHLTSQLIKVVILLGTSFLLFI